MKTMLFFLVLVLSLNAAEPGMVIKTTKGKEYTDMKIVSVDPATLKITHAGGLAKIPMEELPASLQKTLGYDPAGAVAHREKLAAAAKAATEKAAAPAITAAAPGARYFEVKIIEAVDGGFICLSHYGGGVSGEVAQLMGRRDVPEEIGTKPMFVEGLGDGATLGSVWRGQATRDGVMKINGQPLERWVVKP